MGPQSEVTLVERNHDFLKAKSLLFPRVYELTLKTIPKEKFPDHFEQ